ncbi:MAG: Maf family protein [Actinobacteria bacterium]|nr:Maf family protein [Actinomycetota bacterium]
MRTSSSSAAAPGAPHEAAGGAPGLRLVLASRSPQRDALLRQLCIPFRVVVSAHIEDLHDGDPVLTVERNARGKAEEVLARTRLRPGELVLGVDTVVVAGGRVLGKAAGEQEAAQFLRLLAGRRHEVYSGLYLCSPERAEIGHAVTGVTFRSLGAADVARYVACGEWRERAGAYAIQGVGSALVERVDGDYFNVVGLPVAALLTALAAFGAPPFCWLPAGFGSS